MVELIHYVQSLGSLTAIAAVGLAVCGLAIIAGRWFLAPSHEFADDIQLSPTVRKSLMGSGIERRAYVRRAGNHVEAELAVDMSDETDMSPARVWVVDRSHGGLCVLADAPVQVGSRLRVRPVHEPIPSQWTPIRICSCHRERDGWKVHCQFLKMPTMNLFLLFG